MLTREDLQNITEIVSTIVTREITTLAISTQKQFAAIDARFNKVDERFDRMDARFDEADVRADSFATKTDIARLEGIMLGSITRIERLEDDMRVVKTKLKLA